MSLSKILNSPLLYTLVSGGILVIIGTCFCFFARARKRSLELGVTKEEFNSAMKGSVVFSISPAAGCTRSQAVTFLWRAMGSPEPTAATNPFTDVSADAYYCKAVLWAAEKGITGGTGNNRFSPDMTVTRAQFVTFLYRAAGSPAVTGGSKFTDVTDASAYCYNAILWAAEQGITQGTGANTFSPNDVCSRSQIITFLYHYLAK